MRRLMVALVAAAGLLAAGPIAIGPAGSVVLAHSQLVSSVPGSGEVVPTAPAEVRLVFSEPLDPRFSSADLLDASGRTLLAHAGAPDPADARVLVVPVPHLADGAYTLNWRALSATDGHQTSGFISFGVGSVDPASIPLDLGGSAGSLHAGHDAGTALLEVQARTLADLGFMLAFGLLLIAFAVLGPAGLFSSSIVGVQAWALVAAGAGGLLLGLVSGAGPGLDPTGYLLGTHPGQLLIARAGLALVAAAGMWALAWLGRERAGVAAGGVAGLAGIVLVALGGHASAIASPAPLVAMLVHLAAGGVWIAGLGALLALAVFRSDRAGWMPLVVPRFSALALVSIALVTLTGIYAAWIQTGDLLSLGTDYQVALGVKVGLVIAALAVGAVNYLSGGNVQSRFGGSGRFGARIALESLLAAGVLLAAANLASGSPPAQEQPVPIAAAPGSATSATAAAASLALTPGRTGPNLFLVTTGAPAPQAGKVELRLDRLDTATGESVVALRPAPGESGVFVASGVVLPPDSRWDATVVLQDQAGTETARRRFTFALGADTLTAGVMGPTVDPGLLVAVVLLVAAVFAGGYAIGGGSPPRVDPLAGRRSLLAGALVAAVLGVILLVWSVAP